MTNAQCAHGYTAASIDMETRSCILVRGQLRPKLCVAGTDTGLLEGGGSIPGGLVMVIRRAEGQDRAVGSAKEA